MQFAKAEFVKSLPRAEDLPDDGRPLVAFVGRSNVGKSSLINTLVQQNGLSRVSATPGRTQLINLFSVGTAMYLVDLPGYGYSNVGREKQHGFHQLIHDFLTQAEELKLVIVIIDARVGLTDLDREMLEMLEGLKLPAVIVANKMDKLSKTEGLGAIQAIESEFNAVVIPHSNVTGAGRGALIEKIEQAVR